MRITVFTPTYNRAHLIENLYHSLQRQTYHDFEWVVVDDGSADNTEELFGSIVREDNFFPIRYVKTENGGKHRAINRGVQEASGEMFFIVDSDDYLTDDALEVIDRMEKTIPSAKKDQFCGVCGTRGYNLNDPIGTSFKGEYIDVISLEREKYGIRGDKAEVFYTKIIRRYPFPAFEGEKFVTEAVVWDRMAADGLKLRFYNHITIICNYLPDGLTVQGEDLYFKNPKGYGAYLCQCSKFGKLQGMNKWFAYHKYYSVLKKEYSFEEISENLNIHPLYFVIRMFGLRIFYKLYDR